MQKLRIDEIELSYWRIGEGVPIVFLHGLGSSGRDWEFQVDYFSHRYQVVTFDARGHGHSDKPPGPYSIPLFARDAASLIEILDIAPAHIVGVSMGAMVALQLVLDRPDLVRSVVVVNSGPEVVLRTFKDRLQALQRFLIVRLVGMRKMGEVLSERLLPKPEHAPLRELFVEHWAENDPKAYQESMKAIVGWSVLERLGEIDKPVLVLAADQDYTSVESKRVYLDKIEGAQLVVIEDCRHAMPVECPEEFNRALDDFLEQIG